MPVLNVEELIADRVQAIKEYHREAGIARAQLDVSGGVDSAVMAALLVQALGAQNCTFVHSIFSTNSEQTFRAQDLINALGAQLIVVNYDKLFSDLTTTALHALVDAKYDYREVAERCENDPTIEGSVRSTLRAPIGRMFNRFTGGGIRHGTGNECEDRFLRFYQKGGDGEVDTNPLAMLSKTEVYQLAFGLGDLFGEQAKDAFTSIIDAVPSPDLWGTGDGHSDEAELLQWTGAPFTYGRINSSTGEIKSIGTIERVARFLDVPFGRGVVEDYLFTNHEDGLPDAFLDAAIASNLFEGFDGEQILELLSAAVWVEKVTRHKFNPNCPTLGYRCDLVGQGILTDSLEV